MNGVKVNKYLRGGLSAAAAVLVFYGTRSLLERGNDATPAAQEVVAHEVESMRAQAAREHPGLSGSEGVKQVASERAAKKLASQNPLDQAKTAADMFWGFYWVNTRARPEYCAKRGVDLAPFVASFDKEHGEELARAKTIYGAYGADPEMMIALAMPELRKFIVQDMKDFAAVNQVPLEQGCELLKANAGSVAKSIQLPPQVRQALLGE